MWSHWYRLTALGGCALLACSFDTKPIPPSKLAPNVIGAGRTGPPVAGHSGQSGGAGTGESGSGADSAGSGGAGGRFEAGRSGAGATGSGGRAGGGGGAGRIDRAGSGGGPPQGACQEPLNDGLFCDDGHFCTTGERCQDGVCKGGVATDCSAVGGGCNTAVCDSQRDECMFKPVPDGMACIDGLTCTSMGVCMQGICTVDKECGPTGMCDIACQAGCNCGTLNCEGADDCKASCGGTPCDIDCQSSTRCRAKCEQGGSCQILCAHANVCDAECQPGSQCPLIDCTDTGNCNVKCAAGSTCAVDCRTRANCSQVVCETGAQCVLNCGDNPNCGFMKCYDGAQAVTPVKCANGLLACPTCPLPP